MHYNFLRSFFGVLICLLLTADISFAQHYRLDTLLVFPGKGQTLFFDRSFDGEFTKTGRDSFYMHFKKDTIARLWILTQKTPVTAPDLFPNCRYIDPLNSNPKHFIQRSTQTEAEDQMKRLEAYFSFRVRVPYFDVSCPSSIRFYLDTAAAHLIMNNEIWADSVTKKIANQYSTPFYFRKTEVSNAEYREFVNWVKDSIAHTRLGHLQNNGLIDWSKPINYYDTLTEKQINLLLPVSERFWNRKQIDASKLIYRFVHRPDGYFADTIAVYPDTLSWVNDFSWSFNEPMTNMYFWHPAYNNYPVAGISYWQALAFLEWLSIKLNKQLAAQKKGIKITCMLPSAAEWDMVSTAETRNGKPYIFGQYYGYLLDNSWITDLQVASSNNQFKIHYNNKPLTYYDSARTTDQFITSTNSLKYSSGNQSPELRRTLLRNNIFYGNLIVDKAFHPANVYAGVLHPRHYHYMTLREKKIVQKEDKKLIENPYFRIHLDSNGVSHLDGNVSEWLRNDINESWRPLMEKRLNYWPPLMSAEDSLVRDIERLYYRKLPANGKLVMGGNWYDERYSFVHGKNPAGFNAKTFLNPAEQHCTVGFRYVIYVTEITTVPSK